MVKMFSRAVICFLAVWTIVGCEKKQESSESAAQTYDEMKWSDSMVIVNGKKLTKLEFYEKLSAAYQNLLKRERGNQNVAGQMILRERGRMIDAFIGRRILADAAVRQNLVPTNELKQIVVSNMTALAASKNLTLDAYRMKEPHWSRYMQDAIEERVLINAFMATNIIPNLGITPEVVTNYLAAVDEENETISKTNELKKAQLARIRKECLSNPGEWPKFADEISIEGSDESEMEYGDFTFPSTAEIVFRTKVGGITEPIEEEDHLRIVKVVAATEPGSTNSFGEVSARGTRTCSQICIEKEPLCLKWGFEGTMKELRQQATDGLLKSFLETARTNGTNVIEFPHGTDFWGMPKAKKLNPAKAPGGAAAQDNSKDATKNSNKPISKETANKDKENK